jgi:ferredoxin
MNITVDQQKCIGCGRCTEICPGVFQLNENGKSTVIKDDDTECAMRAADECPVEAITVKE